MDPMSSVSMILRAELAKAAVVGTASIVTVVLLTFEDIVNWFRDHEALMESDVDNCAFTLYEREHKIIQAIFNTRTQKILAARTITSQCVDAKLAEIHDHQELVLYT